MAADQFQTVVSDLELAAAIHRTGVPAIHLGQTQQIPIKGLQGIKLPGIINDSVFFAPHIFPFL